MRHETLQLAMANSYTSKVIVRGFLSVYDGPVATLTTYRSSFEAVPFDREEAISRSQKLNSLFFNQSFQEIGRSTRNFSNVFLYRFFYIPSHEGVSECCNSTQLIMSNYSDPSQNPAHEHYFVDPNWPDPNGPHDARKEFHHRTLPQVRTVANWKLTSDHHIRVWNQTPAH